MPLQGYAVADLVAAQKRHCVYCGKYMKLCGNEPTSATIEHVVPRSAKIKHLQYNRVLACKKCNNARGNYPLGTKHALKCRYTILAAHAAALAREIDLTNEKSRRLIASAVKYYEFGNRGLHADVPEQ